MTLKRALLIIAAAALLGAVCGLSVRLGFF